MARNVIVGGGGTSAAANPHTALMSRGTGSGVFNKTGTGVFKCEIKAKPVLMANRLVEKSRARVSEAVTDRLETGEEIQFLLFAVTRPSFWLDALVSPLLAMLQRSWYVVLTDRRVFMVRLARASGRPTGIEWDEPRAGVRVERYKPGLLMGKLFLRRATDGRVLKLRFLFRYRQDALAIRDALGG